MPKHPFQVNQQTSGYNGVTKYIVVRNPGRRRVSVHAEVTRASAQWVADSLNIQEMVKPEAEDPRPYAERLAEATAAYAAEKEKTP